MSYSYYDKFAGMSIGSIPFRPHSPAEPTYRRGWVDEAVAAIEADQCRTADTHLIRLLVPALAGIDIYLKDESTHPTGSLKHRLTHKIFRSDQLQPFVLAASFVVDGVGNLRIHFIERAGHVGIFHG